MTNYYFQAVFVLAFWMAVSLYGVDITSFQKDGISWDEAFVEARKSGRQIVLPGGRYELSKPLEVNDGMTLIFEDGAELYSTVSPVIRHIGGLLLIEGRGTAGIIRCTAQGERGRITMNRGAGIDMNTPSSDNMPSLVLRNMEFRCFNGVDGYQDVIPARETVPIVKNNIASIEIAGCRFLCAEKGVAFSTTTLGRACIEHCIFDGCDAPVMLNTPISEGASILCNELHDFGRQGIQIGKAGQVADGCTTHLPHAIVQGNRLLKGGRGATVQDSYIQGILVYGNHVVVEGNIVRDVNRGEPVPNEPIGHQVRDEEGNIIRGHWAQHNGQKARLAGAAIYLKANCSIVTGNICTNSGYRSVIEIKTGGKEPFVSVSNNIVDGHALDIEESFGFECNSGHSVWMNNVVFDMPHEAFVVRSGYENTFTNNLIVNAKIGFGLSGAVPGQGEWFNGNRFINVEIPIAIDGKPPRPADIPEVAHPGPVYLSDNEELPEASPEWRGRMVVKGKSIYVCIVDGSQEKWMSFSGTVIEPKKYIVVGKELAFNADQSGTEKCDDPLLSDPAFPGWSFFMRTATEKPLDAHDGYITFDTENFKTGGRSLKVLFPVYGSEWSATQKIKVRQGHRYRATALVKGDEPRNFYLQVRCGGKSSQVRGTENLDWQMLSVDFLATSSACDFIIRGAKTSPGKNAWVDSISLREIVDENDVFTDNMVVNGPDMLPIPLLAEDGKLKSPWHMVAAGDILVQISDDKTLALESRMTGNFMLSTEVMLKAGTYRFEVEMETSTPDSLKLNVKLPDGKRFSGQTDAMDDHVSRCDFTLEKDCKVQVAVWGGSQKPGARHILKHMTLKELK